MLNTVSMIRTSANWVHANCHSTWAKHKTNMHALVYTLEILIEYASSHKNINLTYHWISSAFAHTIVSTNGARYCESNKVYIKLEHKHLWWFPSFMGFVSVDTQQNQLPTSTSLHLVDYISIEKPIQVTFYIWWAEPSIPRPGSWMCSSRNSTGAKTLKHIKKHNQQQQQPQQGQVVRRGRRKWRINSP